MMQYIRKAIITLFVISLLRCLPSLLLICQQNQQILLWDWDRKR